MRSVRYPQSLEAHNGHRTTFRDSAACDCQVGRLKHLGNDRHMTGEATKYIKLYYITNNEFNRMNFNHVFKFLNLCADCLSFAALSGALFSSLNCRFAETHGKASDCLERSFVLIEEFQKKAALWRERTMHLNKPGK